MDNRIALALNRIGEILLFRNQRLTFARRGGIWHFLTHEPVVTQIIHPHNRDVRRAVYESCLDASFARTGACIGLLSGNQEEHLEDIADKKDIISLAKSPKSRFMDLLISRMPFRDLDRRLRQELLAIDGSTILDHTGNVVAVGAIIKLPKGSREGGRAAAARVLGEYGTGIKVSQDGRITGFRKDAEEGDVTDVFSIM